MAKTEVTGSQIKDQSVDLTVDITGVLPVTNGGSGSNFIPLNNVLLGNGNGAFQNVAPGEAGYVLTSDGNTWVSAPSVASGEVTVNGEQTLTNKTFLSPVINALPNETPLFIQIDGNTVFTFNQYGEFYGLAGHGIFYDSNISTTAFSSYGELNLSSGKSSNQDLDITLSTSGNGKINLNASSVEVNGLSVSVLDENGQVPLSQWGYQVVDGGSAESAVIDVIDGGSA